MDENKQKNDEEKKKESEDELNDEDILEGDGLKPLPPMSDDLL